MNTGDQFLIIGLLLFLIPVTCMTPWWIKELFRIGDEQKKKEVNQK